MAQVIQSGKATLRELREIYSLEDMYNIWETVHTEAYNEWQRKENAAKHAKMLRGR